MSDEVTGRTTTRFHRQSSSKVRVLTNGTPVLGFYLNGYANYLTQNPVPPGNRATNHDYGGAIVYFTEATMPWPEQPAGGGIFEVMQNYARSSINLPVMVAELADTIKMFHRPWSIVAAMGRAPSQLKKQVGKRKGALDKLLTLGGEYLGYRYGLRPFISDLKEVSALSGRLEDRLSRDFSKPRTIKSRRTASNTSTGRYTSGSSTNGGFDTKSIFTREIERTEFAQVSKNPSWESQSLATHFLDTFHVRDVASVAWELVPYSFVVDWFLPIGDIIDNFSPAPAYLVSTGNVWCGIKTTERRERSVSGKSVGKATTFALNAGYTVEKVTYGRNPMGMLPPKPVNLDGYQVADLACMAGQQLGRLFGKSFRR